MDLAHGKRGMDLHDPLAVGVALDPTLVRWEPVCLAVGPDGQTRRTAGEPNARFAHVVDAPRFLSMFLERLCPAC
jgi:purine nucleosidase